MAPTILHLTSLSAKIALLGGLAWLQLYFLRRAPAASRSRLCSLALIAIVLLAAGEMVVTPTWLVNAPVFYSTNAARTASPAVARTAATSWVALLWASGALLMLVRAVAGRITMATLRRRSRLSARVSGLDVRIGDVETPILTGLRRPAILLPASASEWTDEQRRMVLAHELTHFRRGDCWSNMLAEAVRAAFWFHPLVWLLVSRMSREQEMTCDEAVVASGHSRHDYAAFLLDAVRSLHSSELFACPMAGSGARSLKQRFANLLDSRSRPPLTRRLAAFVALFAATAIVLALVHPVWSQNDKVSAQPPNETPNQDEVYKVGGDVLPPKLLSHVEPSYTEEARMNKISGPVYLSFVVTPEGTAENIEVTSGIDPGLDHNAMEAVSQWTFQPGTKDGKAVAVLAHAQVNYRLL